MKSKKLNLNELKVKSFVTDFENGKEHTVKAGKFPAPSEASGCPGGCYSDASCSGCLDCSGIC